jgi:hypothetical protein
VTLHARALVGQAIAAAPIDNQPAVVAMNQHYQRRFAAAGEADQGDLLACRDMEVDSFKDQLLRSIAKRRILRGKNTVSYFTFSLWNTFLPARYVIVLAAFFM